MFQRINTPLTRLRDDFYRQLNTNKPMNDKREEQEKIFAEVLSRSGFFGFPLYKGYGFSVRKQVRTENHGMFGIKASTVWMVDLTVSSETHNTSHTIGTVCFDFKGFEELLPSVSFSNLAVQEMVEKKKSFAQVRHLLEKPASATAVEEGTAFLEKYEKTQAAVERIYAAPANKNDVGKQAEKATVLRLLADILENPKSDKVTDFDADKLMGGRGFVGVTNFSIFGILVVFFAISIAIVIAGSIGMSFNPSEPTHALMQFGFSLFATLLGSFGAICSGLCIYDHIHSHFRKDVAKEVGELLQHAKDLTPAAAKAFESKIQTPILAVQKSGQNSSESAVTYQVVLSQKDSSTQGGEYQWLPKDSQSTSYVS